jgi:hypothetical protein
MSLSQSLLRAARPNGGIAATKTDPMALRALESGKSVVLRGFSDIKLLLPEDFEVQDVRVVVDTSRPSC